MSADYTNRVLSSDSEVEEEKHHEEVEDIPILLVEDLSLNLSGHLLNVVRPLVDWKLAAPIIRTVDLFHDNQIPDFQGYTQRWTDFRANAIKKHTQHPKQKSYAEDAQEHSRW